MDNYYTKGCMENYMDDLTECFNNSTIINLYNPTSFHLYVEQGALYTHDLIEANKVIGELQGIPCYIWEIKHNEYIVIDDELVLNIQQYKGNMLSHIREENLSSNMSNCYIRMVLKENGETHFYLMTKKEIFPHQELVYNAFDFQNEINN